MPSKKIFSFDAETDGLWGQPFAVAAIVYEYIPERNRGIDGIRPAHWEMSRKICMRLPNSLVTNQWVIENVLPTFGIASLHPAATQSTVWEKENGFEKSPAFPATHENYEEMLRDFAAFYLENKQDADVICHMGYVVEAHLLREMHRLGFIGDWDAPYPLYDVAGNLQAANEDATSVDDYVKKYNIEIPDFGSTHNPLYDCAVTAEVYIHLNRQK